MTSDIINCIGTHSSVSWNMLIAIKMTISTFLVLVFFQNIRICTVGASAGDSCLQESTTRSYPKFEAVVDTASNDSVIHVASTTVLSAIVSLIG